MRAQLELATLYTRNICYGAYPCVAAGYKKYVPTYDLKGEKRGGNKLYCEVCERYFNGSVPYDSHMRSKAHKEEVELAKQYGRLWQ